MGHGRNWRKPGQEGGLKPECERQAKEPVVCLLAWFCKAVRVLKSNVGSKGRKD